jgi:hypothetical protein
MRAASPFAPVAIALTLLVGLAPAPACAGPVTAVILNNLDQPASQSGPSAFVGQSFIAGASTPLYGAEMLLNPSVPSSDITLEVEARTAAGTVGQTLFSDFSASYDARSGLVTFLANSPFELTAGEGYWLVLSDNPTNKGTVTWDFTTSPVYQSDLGYGLPSYNTAWYSDADNGMGISSYYQPSDGPQMFELIAVVDEPATYVLMGIGAIVIGYVGWFHRARSSRLSRLLAGRATGTVRP